METRLPDNHIWVKRHPPTLLDDELNLKPSKIWLSALALLTFPTWYGIGSATAKFSQGEWLPWIGYHNLNDWLLSFVEQLPALIVLGCLFRRSARAKNMTRRLWRISRQLLIATAAGQILHNVIFLIDVNHSLTLPILIKIVLYAWLIWYYLASRFAKDFPKSFPLPDSDSIKR